MVFRHPLRRFRAFWGRRGCLFRLVSIAFLFVVVVVMGFLWVPPLKAGLHTGLFVLQILDVPFKPQARLTATPLREEVAYPTPTGQGLADVYRAPDGRKRAATLLFLGANAAGRDDADVINLGNALSRAGFVVMVHWSPTMGLKANIDPEELENLVWAFKYLREQDYVDESRVGMGGFSVGGSFVMVAASDSRINEEVLFLNSFGAYYDARSLFLQIASGTSVEEDGDKPWAVDKLTWRVFANELLETVEDPEERAALAERFASEEGGQAGEKREPEELEKLSPGARTVARLLAGPSPAEAAELLDALPEDFHRKMTRISPSAYIGNLKARLMIMHDRGDTLIPVGESRRLAAGVEERGNFRYTETSIFEHVRPGGGQSWRHLATEAVKLYRHMYAIVRVAH